MGQPTAAARVLVSAALLLTALVVVSPAEGRRVPRCFGKRATIVGNTRPNRIVGTPRSDVIVGGGGGDIILGRGGADLICGGGGNDEIYGGGR